MLKFITEFLKRLSSRKFLITIGSMALVVTFPEAAEYIVTLSVGFVAAEGVGDAAERYKRQAVKAEEVKLEDTKLTFGELGDYTGDRPAGPGPIVPGDPTTVQ
jgi:hypothetical protein